MCFKMFVVLVILLTISDIGCALICNQCLYQSTQPKDQQKCGNVTVDCPTGYCYSAAYITEHGIHVVDRHCDKPNDRYCPDSNATCRNKTQESNLKKCVGICCTTDNCNNYTPSVTPSKTPSSGLKCNQCHYRSDHPEEEQKCGSETEACSTGYCYSSIFITSNNVTVVQRACDSNPKDRLCPSNNGETCKRKTMQNNLKSCVGICCTTDNCNNNTPTTPTPSTATDVMAAKFTLCVMIIVGFSFA